MTEILEPVESDARRSAEEAGLHYLPDVIPGITRKRRGKGFAYYSETGQFIQDVEQKNRIQSLAIPPAWKEVWISPDPEGHLQATGRDDKGRKQYIYHPDWDAVRNRGKFDRMVEFATALPTLRERIDQDLRKRSFTREKVLAIIVRLLERTLIRIGNPEYARRNRSYGLTTLENEHFEVHGSTLIFSFVGKSGVEQEIEVRDRRLASQLSQVSELPGQRLFQYVDENGNPQTIDSGDVNTYLRDVCGESFSAKDFRTWGATTLAAIELYVLGPSETKTEQKRKIVEAVRRVAEALGNTPTICRQYYIHPDIVAAYEDGSLFLAIQKAAQEVEETTYGLDVEETAVIRILKEKLPIDEKIGKINPQSNHHA